MNDIVNNVRRFDLPTGMYSVVGGGALAARGIRTYNDVDLIVTEDLYERLKNCGWKEEEKSPNFFHLYFENAEAAKDFSHIKGCDLNTLSVIENSEMIEGLPFISLNDLIELKRAMGREKDLKDIELILDFMRNHPSH